MHFVHFFKDMQYNIKIKSQLIILRIARAKIALILSKEVVLDLKIKFKP
jgi:hypothetical protein